METKLEKNITVIVVKARELVRRGACVKEQVY